MYEFCLPADEKGEIDTSQPEPHYKSGLANNRKNHFMVTDAPVNTTDNRPDQPVYLLIIASLQDNRWCTFIFLFQINQRTIR